MNNAALILDGKARKLAKDYLLTEGELLSVLTEMHQRKLFVSLNYANIFEYCEKALNLSRSQAYYFKSVAEKSVEVPEVKQAVVEGKITLSQARRIVPAVTKENHEEWIEKAQTLSQKELEREVTVVNPRAHVQENIRPVAPELNELRVPVNLATEENLKVLQDVLSQKKGKHVGLGEVIEWMAERMREQQDPVKKAERSKSISSGNQKPGRRPIPAAIKHAVVKRDQNRCTHVSPDGRRCEARRWLHLHHIVEVSKGGTNTVENLTTLCAAHHRWRHQEELTNPACVDSGTRKIVFR